MSIYEPQTLTQPEPDAATAPRYSSSILQRAAEATQRREDRKLHAKMQRAARRLVELQNSHVNDATLGHPLPQPLKDLHTELSRQLFDDIGQGACVHNRLPWTMRRLPGVVAALDAVVLLTFCFDLFNVDPGHLDQSPLQTAAAAMLATLGSGVAYTWLALTGRRLRSFRSSLGELEWQTFGVLTWFMLPVAVAVSAVLAALMNERVQSAVLSMDGAAVQHQAQLFGIGFAALSVIANISVVAVHALDGSDLAAHVRHSGKVLRRHERHIERLTCTLENRRADGDDPGLTVVR